MTLRSYQCWNSPRIPTVADPLRNFFNPGPVDQPVWSPVGIYRRLLPMESSPGNRRKPKKNPGRRRPFRSKHGPAKQDPASRGKTKSSSSSRDRRARKKKKKSPCKAKPSSTQARQTCSGVFDSELSWKELVQRTVKCHLISSGALQILQ